MNDGDSHVAVHDEPEVEIRFQGSIALRLAKPAARKRNRPLAHGTNVAIKPICKDRYGRTLADVIIIPDDRNIGPELVRLGAIWWYRKYSDGETLAKLEAEAR